MNKITAAVIAMLFLISCTEEKPPVVVPDFNRLPHVENCIPALLALDELAYEAAGTQMGERVSGAPWLRIDRGLIDQRDATHLNPKSLGPVIMPMLTLAQKSLTAEIGAIEEADLSQWAETYEITQGVTEFMSYCTRESAFAQWRDSAPTISFVQSLALSEKTSSWWHWFSPKTEPVEEVKTTTWAAYKLKSQSTKRVAVVKDVNGTKSIGSDGEMTMLERYAPTWLVADNSASLVSWQTDQNSLKTSEQMENFAYIDYAFVLHKRMIRLNYISWWQNEKDKITGVLYRINMGFDGRPAIYETVQLSGKNYRLFLTKDFAVHELPEGLFETTLNRSAAKMIVRLSGWPLDVQSIEPLSGVSNIEEYTLAPMKTLYQLPSGDKTQSLFDENGLVKYQQNSSFFKSLFSGVEQYGTSRAPDKLVIDTQRGLYFDQPDLLTEFRISKVYQAK